MNEKEFSSSELKEARNNGFLLGGKTGAGKSTLLNCLFGKNMTEVKRSAKAVTTDPNVYFYKLENKKCISIIDTPGLSDPKNIQDTNTDNIHLDKIIKIVKKENIIIKGILFLVNFQSERFDSNEAEALINYNKIFPLKRFWQHVLIIFTHLYSDPNGDTTEEMKNDRDLSNKEIFKEIMEKVKNVSDVIDYKNLNTKYFNSYWPIKEEKKIEQIKCNNENRKNLELSLNEFSQKNPLFSKIEIVLRNDQIIQDNNKYYIVDFTIIGYFDLNDKEPKKEEKIITKYKEIEKPPNNINSKTEIIIQQGERNSSGNIEIVNKEATNKNSYYYREIKNMGIGGIIGAGLGTVIGGVLVLTNPVGLAGLLAYGSTIVIGGGAAGGGIVGGIIGGIKSLFSN